MERVDLYCDLSAIDALELIDDKELFLPDIQRDFVWSKEGIEDLFESIAKGYPIGAFIFWKTSKQKLLDSNQSFYEFIKNKTKDVVNPTISIDAFPDSSRSKYYVVLDGQQRLTSINIGLRGEYHYKEKYKWWKKPYKESCLYFNLEYDDKNDKELKDKLFMFREKGYISNGLIPMPKFYDFIASKKQVLKKKVDNIKEFNELLLNGLKDYDFSSSIRKKNIKYLLDLCYRLFVDKEGKNDALIHFYQITKDEYDYALDIFVKVNSSGAKLTKNDLLYSRLVNHWERFSTSKDPKKEFKEILDNLNYYEGNTRDERFDFDLDYLIRCSIFLLSPNVAYRIDSLDKNTIDEIRKNWDNIINSIKGTIEELKKMGYSYYSLASYNAILPIIFFRYYNGSLKNTEMEIKKYLTACSTSQFFSTATNEALRKVREMLKGKKDIKKGFKGIPFKHSLFENISNVNNSLKVDSRTIEKWLTSFKKGSRQAYSVLMVLYDRGKFNNNREILHQDHLHPYANFEDDKLIDSGIILSDDEKKDWLNKRDNLPNLHFLPEKLNKEKSNRTFKEWFNNEPLAKDYIICLPDKSEFSYEFSKGSFEKFYDERARLMQEKLEKIYGLRDSDGNHVELKDEEFR